MLNITDDSIISAADIAQFLGKTERTAGDWIKTHGGKKVCGCWVIVGAKLKSVLLDEDLDSGEEIIPETDRRSFARRSL